MYAGALGTVTGGYRLRVNSADLKKAQQILTQQNPALEDEFLQGIACPKCKANSTELVLDSVFSLPRFLFGFLLLLPTGKRRTEKWKCHDCHRTWGEESDAKLNWRSFLALALFALLMIGLLMQNGWLN